MISKHFPGNGIFATAGLPFPGICSCQNCHYSFTEGTKAYIGTNQDLHWGKKCTSDSVPTGKHLRTDMASSIVAISRPFRPWWPSAHQLAVKWCPCHVSVFRCCDTVMQNVPRFKRKRGNFAILCLGRTLKEIYQYHYKKKSINVNTCKLCSHNNIDKPSWPMYRVVKKFWPKTSRSPKSHPYWHYVGKHCKQNPLCSVQWVDL